MNEWVLLGAMTWLLVLMGAAAVHMVAGRPRVSRLLAFDTLTLLAVAFLLLGSFREAHPHYLDAALMVAMLSFLGTLAGARFLRSGRVL